MVRSVTKLRFELTILIISISALIFVYRLGAPRVDGGFEPGMRDVGTYLRAGEKFLDGNDPYVDPAARFGPSLLPLFGFMNQTLPENVLVIFFQIFSIVGILYFVSRLTSFSLLSNLKIIIVLCWLSSVRENIVNIQVTGLLCFLFGLGYQVVKRNRNPSSRFIGCLLLAASIDSKPHLFGILFLALFLYERRYREIPIVLSIIVFTHSILSLWVGKFLTLSWLQTLFFLYEKRKSGTLGESLVLWPIIEHFGVNKELSSILSILIFVGLLSVLILRVSRSELSRNQVIELSMLVPSFGIFFHYYDLAPLIAVLLVNLLNEDRLKEIVFLLPVALIPGNSAELWNFLIILGAFFLLMLDFRFARLRAIDLLTAIGIWTTYSIIMQSFSNYDLKQEAQVTTIAIWLLMICFRKELENNRADRIVKP